MEIPALAIVNPVAAGGRAGKRWPTLLPALAERLPGLEIQATRRAGDGEVLGREWAARHRLGIVVVVGGDGSLHEAVNGLVAAGWQGTLGVVPAGTGNDFARSSGLPLSDQAAVARIGVGPERRVDLGVARFANQTGATLSRHFLNAISVGVSPSANRLAHGVKAVLPNRLAYPLCGALALLLARRTTYQITHAGVPFLSGRALNITVANGASFGGGMRISPGSTLDDGILDQIVIGPLGRARALLALSRVYQGSHVRMPGVTVTPVRGSIQITGDRQPMQVEADGHDFDAYGTLSIDVAPGKLTLFS